jgi:hypothetical protein
MIGGADIVLFAPTMPQDADLILRSLRTEWPNARVQAVDSAEAVPFRQVHFPIVGPAEFIVYRDKESFDSWQLLGATAENQSTMIHVIIAPESATIVVDRPDSPLASLAREMLESLSRNRITLAAA